MTRKRRNFSAFLNFIFFPKFSKARSLSQILNINPFCKDSANNCQIFNLNRFQVPNQSPPILVIASHKSPSPKLTKLAAQPSKTSCFDTESNTTWPSHCHKTVGCFPLKRHSIRRWYWMDLGRIWLHLISLLLIVFGIMRRSRKFFPQPLLLQYWEILLKLSNRIMFIWVCKLTLR